MKCQNVKSDHIWFLCFWNTDSGGWLQHDSELLMPIRSFKPKTISKWLPITLFQIITLSWFLFLLFSLSGSLLEYTILRKCPWNPINMMQSNPYPEINIRISEITAENCTVSNIWTANKIRQTHHPCLLEVVSSGSRWHLVMAHIMGTVPGLINSSYLIWPKGQVLKNCNIMQQIAYHVQNDWCLKQLMQHSSTGKLCSNWSIMLEK